MESLKLLDRPIPSRNKLNILISLADGRLDALRFVREHIDNLVEIQSEIAKVEEYLSDEDLLQGPMKLGAGPRTYRDGYLAALKEALSLIESNSTDKA